MLASDFNSLKYRSFNGEENWGDISKVSYTLVEALDKFQYVLGYKVYIAPEECSVYDPNKKRALHNMGIAAHVYSNCNILYALMVACQMNEFGGIGVYPSSFWKEKKLYGKLHLDVRTYSVKKNLWWVDSKNNIYKFDKNDFSEKFIDEVYKAMFKQNRISK
jgi:hypothetical protein